MENAKSNDGGAGGGSSSFGERPPPPPPAAATAPPIAVAVAVSPDAPPPAAAAPAAGPPRTMPPPPSESDEEALRAVASAAQDRGVAVVRRHCDAHLAENPDSSYVTWIATLHPENAKVSIDPRFLVPGNPWLAAYEEARGDAAAWEAAPDGGKAGAAGAVGPVPSALPLEDGDGGGGVADDDPNLGTKPRYSLIDSLVGGSLVVASVSSAFALEAAGAYCYLSYWLCSKVVDVCSPPNVVACLPICVAFAVGQLFRLIDALLLVASTLLVEGVAASNYILSTILACSHARGRAMHQTTRKMPHLVRWAFRQKFETWDPPRMTFGTSS